MTENKKKKKSKIYYFQGTAYWAKVFKPDQKYGHYCIDLVLDEDSLARLKECPLDLKIRDDEKGKWVRFRRKPEATFKGETVELGPPTVLKYNPDQEEKYTPFDRLIGNGSKVDCKVTVYETSRGYGHRLEAVAVLDHVPYDDFEDDNEYPF